MDTGLVCAGLVGTLSRQMWCARILGTILPSPSDQQIPPSPPMVVFITKLTRSRSVIPTVPKMESNFLSVIIMA